MTNQLIKTEYGYDYRGVAITRRKRGFTFGRISEFNYNSSVGSLKECCASIDNYLDNLGAKIERYRIKVGA
jgi:hypothetical protein